MIDFIYVISNIDEKAINRLKYSMYSLTLFKHEFNIKIFDYSFESNKNLLNIYLKDFTYEYTYYNRNISELIFNKSKCINLAYENIIKTEKFILSDIDILYPKNYYEYIKNNIEKDVILFNMFQLYSNVVINEQFIKNYVKLNELNIYTKTDKSQIWTGTGLFIDSKVFEEINGYDEGYYGWGAEDSDFTNRMYLFGADVLVSDTNDVYILHQYHDSRAITEREFAIRNEKRINERNKLYQNKIIKINQINGLKKLETIYD